jgi:two-component system, NarL family, response regulator NreC
MTICIKVSRSSAREQVMAASFRVLLADNHVMFRHGVRRILQSIDDLEVVGEAGDGLELIDILKQTSPHMVILNNSMPDLDGLKATYEIKMINHDVKVMILTIHNNKDYLYRAFRAGARGYLLKEDADSKLISAINIMRQGGIYISPLLSSPLVMGYL